MKLRCPACAAVYDVPDDAIGARGRRVRCRACDTSWVEPGRGASLPPTPAPLPPPPAPVLVPPPVPVEPEPAPPPVTRRRRVPWLVLLLGIAVVGLGALAATLTWGPDEVAGRLGLAPQRVPLGIALTREPDWQLIAGGSQLFALSGRVWNPTAVSQPVPDIRAELKDRAGRTVYAWTITRPVARLAPGRSAVFDGAAVDVPPSSARISVRFADTNGG